MLSSPPSRISPPPAGGPYLIIIDGLDECLDLQNPQGAKLPGKTVLEFLSHHASVPRSLKFIFTSRPVPEVAKITDDPCSDLAAHAGLAADPAWEGR